MDSLSPEDPRPDLPGDHPFWEAVLIKAYLIDPDAFGLLHGLRSYGARLLATPQGYQLQPRYRPDGGWRDESEWKGDREKWLTPKTAVLRSILST